MELAASSGSWLSSSLLTLLFLRLPESVSGAGDAGEFHMAPLGGTAKLLCPVSLWPVAVPDVVSWLRSSPLGRSQAVHMFRDGKDREEDVMPEYKGRTNLVRNAGAGSVMLEIRDVRMEDRGLYQCQVQVANQSREGTVTLQVAVLGSDPYIHVKGYDAGWIHLVCRSVGWFPEPRAEWRDPEGRVLLSLSEAHSLDEAGLFQTAVSSRVRDSALGNVSCIIHNLALGQEKTTAMAIAAPSPEKLSSSAVALAVVLPVLGLLITVGIFLIWKQRRSKEKLLYEQMMEVENLLSDHAKEKGRLHKTHSKFCFSSVTQASC
ncbi:Erythroid Membrane-Associated Protein [Manis pentadactyla]|nr:Erythroid Membrane-Associated Protein [Manis pentadactyla]